MLDIKDVLEIVTKHSEVIGEEGMAELKLSLMEKDVPGDEALKAELEAEKAGREEDKANYESRIKEFNDRFDKFIRGEDPEPSEEEQEEEVDVEEDVVVSEDDFYDRMYGKEE